MYIKEVVIGCIICAGALSYMTGGNVSETAVEDAVAKYGLSEAQTSFTRICASSIKNARLEFKHGAPTVSGCGCIASELGKKNLAKSPADYALRGDLMAVVADAASDESEAGMFDELNEVASEHSVTVIEAMTSMAEMSASMEYCGSRYKATKAIQPTGFKTTSQKCVQMSEAQKKQYRQIAAEHNLIFDEACGTMTRK